MDPSREDLEKMLVLEHAMKWAGVKAALKTAMDETMGQLEHFREVVLCPEPLWSQAVAALRIVVQAAQPEVAAQGVQGQAGFVPGTPGVPRVDRPPNVLEAAQVGMIRRISSLRLNVSPDPVPGAAQGPGQGPPPSSASAPPAATTAGKLAGARISEVIDQADHAEVAPWTPDRVRAALAVYRASNRGVKPKAAYTPTGLQFAALEYKLRVTNTAYVDFGIWRRNGGRLERRMRLTVHQRNFKGDWIPYEIAGPSNFLEWQHGWRLLTVAMRALDEADQQDMEAFEATVEDLVQTFGEECWWIVAQGEGRMRSERLPILLDAALEEKESAEKKGEIHPLDPKRPWGYLLRKASEDREFWTDEVKDKCHRWLARTLTREAITEENFGPVHPGDSGLLQISQAAGAPAAKRARPLSVASSDSEEPPSKVKTVMKRSRGTRGKAKAKARSAREKADAKTAQAPWRRDDRSGKGKGKGKGKKQTHTAAGVEICFGYARAGTCKTPCPNKRAHVCEYCLQGNHKSAECSQR